MTRTSFIEDVTTWDELVEFCRCEDCDICEDLVAGDRLDDYIKEDFSDYGYEYPWTDIRRWLNEIVEGQECYVRNGSFKYEYLTPSDFDAYKDDVMEWMDEGGILGRRRRVR